MRRRKCLYLLTLSALLLCSCGGSEEKKDDNTNINDDKEKDDNADKYYSPEINGKTSVCIHYYRKDGVYNNWALWLWSENNDGKEYTFNGLDSFGAFAYYNFETLGLNDENPANLGFIVKSLGSWNAKDYETDRFIEFSKYTKDSNNIYNVYLVSEKGNIYIDKDLNKLEEISNFAFDYMKNINKYRLYFTTSVAVKHYKFMADGEILAEKDIKDTFAEYIYDVGVLPDFKKNYSLEVTFSDSGNVETANADVSILYKDEQFDKNYSYEGELGAIYSTNETVFKVWSPYSDSIKLRIYENGTPTSVDETKGSDKFIEYTMTSDEKGVFSYTLTGDQEGKYYTYVVSNRTYSNEEIVDPYAKSTGVNGLRGMVVNFEKTNPDGWTDISPLSIDRKNLVVYETHVQDITSSSSWGGTESKKYTFDGAFEENTTYQSGEKTYTTGFDHIKELGVNAVQLLPIFDQANDEVNKSFNWGYNPLNYNSLEGAYSSNAFDGYVKIKEFKNLVKAYNENGMNIIMDVVYNHVNGALKSNFDVLMPGYYYRYSGNGVLSNGSGCGNETASEMPMFRKFMIDSTNFWASEYKLGGFRFDLMGLHDLDTMNELVANLKETNENIVVYGEPWSGGTSTLSDTLSAKQLNENKYDGYGAFNDKMRDALIKGGLNGADSLGWITDTNSVTSSLDIESISNGIKGYTVGGTVKVSDPNKTLNYVTCHDNYTLVDRIDAAGISDKSVQKKMAMLANSVVLTSQGTSFMLSGEEFLRTKGGNSNSYNASYEVNELNYALKAENEDVFENYKKLISLKTKTNVLNLEDTSAIKVDVNSDSNTFEYKINSDGKEYYFIHRNGYKESDSKAINLTGYEVYLDTSNELNKDLANYKVNALSSIIATKTN